VKRTPSRRANDLFGLTSHTARPLEPLDWAGIHTKNASWRKQLIGEMNDIFVVPRYVKLFYDTFGNKQGQSFLEVRSGDGDLPHAILAPNHGEIASYTVSDCTPSGAGKKESCRAGIPPKPHSARPKKSGDNVAQAVQTLERSCLCLPSRLGPL
jgi:hypothetical protein